MIAAAIGFGLAKTEVLDAYLPSGASAKDVQIEALKSAQAQLLDQLEQTTSQLNALRIPDLDPLAKRIDALEANANSATETSVDLAPVEAALSDLQSKLAALEARPVTASVSAEVTQAFEAEIARLQNNVTTQRAEVEAMFEKARALEEASTAAAKTASAQTILARLRAALDAGQPFAGMVDELSALGVDVPAALTARAADGVLPLAALTEGFAPAARDALAAVRSPRILAATVLLTM